MLQTSNLMAFINQSLLEMATNRMRGPDLDRELIWDSPQMGFARGDDNLFTFFKTDIGSFYFLPEEAFSLKYPGPVRKPLTVMSLAFPHKDETLRMQRVSTRLPSSRWSYSRQHWQEFAADLSERIMNWLSDRKIRSVDPEQLPEWNRQDSGKYGFASSWSQRHTAYAAGLGTFGLSDGLITEKGKAVRFISIILETELPPTPRAYATPQEWCLFYRDGSCGLCIGRCPAQAISPAGHDKERCAAYCQSVNQALKPDQNRTAGCGLCQAGIPCENRRP